MPKKKKFCQPWLIKIISCIVVYDYIIRDIGTFVSVKKFFNFLNENYDNVEQDEIEMSSTMILQFLGELKSAQDTYLLLNHYMYSLIEEIKPDEKGIFKKDPYEGMTEKKYDIDKVVEDFKVFAFSCRSGLTTKAPTGWDIRNDERLGLLSDIINKDFSIDDMIDSVT